MTLKGAKKAGLLRWMYKLFCAYAEVLALPTDDDRIDDCSFCEYDNNDCKDCPLYSDAGCAGTHWIKYIRACKRHYCQGKIKHAEAILDMIEAIEV